MSPRVFLGWLVAAVVTVVLTVFVGIGSETASFDLVKREPVFAELRKAPDSVARIEIKSRFDEFNMVKGAGGWVTPERDGYPIDEGDVRRLVVGLSDMRFVERKTANPDRFYRLEVQDIDEELSDSASVKVWSGDDAVLAEAIIGRPSARFFDGRVSGTYIREPGTNNVWLVTGVTNVQTRLVPWLRRDIVKIAVNRVAKVSIGEGLGSYTLSRMSASEKTFSMTGGPPGRELDGGKAAKISRALASVELEDVRPRDDIVVPSNATIASVSTFDGMTVNVRLFQFNRKKWANFEAMYTGDGSDQSDEAQASRARVDEFNKRVDGWTYWIPSATFKNLTRPLEDVLAGKEDKSS